MAGSSKRRAHLIKMLDARIEAIKVTIDEVELRRKLHPDRERPSDEYLNTLRFELRSFQAKLNRLLRPAKIKVTPPTISLAKFKARLHGLKSR